MGTVTNIVESYVANEALEELDMVELNTDGKLVKLSAAEATDAVGIVTEKAKKDAPCSVLVLGEIETWLMVDVSGETYDNAIVHGSPLIIGGDAGEARTPGQALVAPDVADLTVGKVVGKSRVAVTQGTAIKFVKGRVAVNFIN